MGFGEELNPETPTIDVHGLSVMEAVFEVELFIDRLFREKESIGRVIVGRGASILLREVPNELQKNPLLERVVPSTITGELGAVLYLVLKR